MPKDRLRQLVRTPDVDLAAFWVQHGLEFLRVEAGAPRATFILRDKQHRADSLHAAFVHARELRGYLATRRRLVHAVAIARADPQASARDRSSRRRARLCWRRPRPSGPGRRAPGVGRFSALTAPGGAAQRGPCLPQPRSPDRGLPMCLGEGLQGRKVRVPEG